MKIAHVFGFLAFASAALADNAGSYALVTSTLVLNASDVAVPTVLANGNKEFKSTWGTYKVTNAAILAECQRQGILTAGSVSAWKLYAVFDRNNLAGFVINNGLDTLSIDDVISVYRDGQTGFATKGKWVKNTQGAVISGSTTYLDGFVLTVSIGGVKYLATVAPKISDKVVSFGVLADPVWKPAAFKISPVGISEAGDTYNAVLTGSLSIAAAKANWNLGLSLLNFPGFASDEE